MKYFHQMWRHSPENGYYGDCFRTCIGCLLDRQPHEVPHFFDGLEDKSPQDKVDDAYERMRIWLGEQGVCLYTAPYTGATEEVLNTMEFYNKGIYYILCGSSGDANHAVIAKDNAIVHDPNPEKPGLVGPSSDGYHWVHLLLPIWHKED